MLLSGIRYHEYLISYRNVLITRWSVDFDGEVSCGSDIWCAANNGEKGNMYAICYTLIQHTRTILTTESLGIIMEGFDFLKTLIDLTEAFG